MTQCIFNDCVDHHTLVTFIEITAFNGPRGNYRNWDETSLMNAMVAVERGVSLRRASEMYRVPKSMLYDHVTGKVSFGARSGPDPYLSVEEEEELCNFLWQG